jgi:hypothetical protein
MTSTIDEWRNARHLLPWQPLSRFVNDQFNLSVKEEEWKNILTPSYKRTLYDLCTFLSEKLSTSNRNPYEAVGSRVLVSSRFYYIEEAFA